MVKLITSIQLKDDQTKYCIIILYIIFIIMHHGIYMINYFIYLSVFCGSAITRCCSHFIAL